MIFDGKPVQAISADDLRRLVAEAVEEDRNLEYKERPYTSNAHDRAELAKDVTAFLNADGGYLIIGVREDGNGRAAGFANVGEPEGVRRSIIDRCLTRIDPRPPRLDIGAKDVDGATVLIVRVPESDQKPHCARPDAEHHYFWRRYEDGNKLMTTAEIRECLEGDRVERALAELHAEVSSLRGERTRDSEMARQVEGTKLLELTTTEAFLDHMDRLLATEVGDRPCYRLFACPLPVNQADLGSQVPALRKLVENPPVLRRHGWGLKPYADVRVTDLGVQAAASARDQLRVLRNGCVEYRAAADGESFHWAQTADPKPVNPAAIVEPAATFPLLVKDVCGLAGHQGSVRFQIELRNIKGIYLLPYALEAVGYRRATYRMGQSGGPQPFPDDHLKPPPVEVAVSDLPGDVAWRLVSQVYYRFGYTEEHQVPYFDEEGNCTLGGTRKE